MEKLVESLGITRLSKSQVSVMAQDLDAQVEQFSTRPLDQGPYTFLAADSSPPTPWCSRSARADGWSTSVVTVCALLATGVNGDGHREILACR